MLFRFCCLWVLPVLVGSLGYDLSPVFVYVVCLGGGLCPVFVYVCCLGDVLCLVFAQCYF